MPIAGYFFFVSLAGLVAMAFSKWSTLTSRRPGFLSFLSRYDSALSFHLLRFSAASRRFILSSRTALVTFLKYLGHLFTVYLHQLLQSAERRVRAWREFARERKIERRSASVFIRDVVDYKKELKENGHSHNPPKV